MSGAVKGENASRMTFSTKFLHFLSPGKPRSHGKNVKNVRKTSNLHRGEGRGVTGYPVTLFIFFTLFNSLSTLRHLDSEIV
jgi:hypothetical protein